jgi:hypothetical protein
MRHSNIPTENDSPSSSPEYTTSEDEDASRESLGFSSIRLDNNDSSMGGIALNNGQFPTNFAGIGISNTLSSSLPSTSNADGTPTDSNQTLQNYSSVGTGRKRTFSTSESQPAGDKRTATKICRVCGDKAYSYNFNVITCESCKAFFRRNANKEKDIRCPFNDQCDINIVSRRFCQRCRLQKCFRVGMKKEWIMSEEARMEKKQRILDNRERRAAERKSEESHKRSNGSLAEDLAAAINASAVAQVQAAASVQVPMIHQQQVQQQQPQAPPTPMMMPQAVVPAAPVAAFQPPPQQQQPAPEVAAQQLAAAVAAVAHQNPVAAAAVVAASQLPPQTFQPQINDAGQMATERALAASIVANANASLHDQPTSNPTAPASLAAAHQQQIVSQLVMQNQLQQQAVQQMAAVQAAAAVQAQVQINQQAAAAVQAQVQINQLQQQQQAHAHQQLAAAVVAAAASTMVPNGPPSQQQNSVVTVPSMQQQQQQTSQVVHSMQQSQQVAPPQTTNNPSTDLVAVPRDVLIKLVEQKIESEQQAQQQAGGIAPLKCQCHCTCGRYPADLLIVDKVMTDLLENSTKYNNSKPLGQLSPKMEQVTPPTLMSTTPPNFFQLQQHQQQFTSPPGFHQHHQHQQQQICVSANAGVGGGLPQIPMEEDYVFKSIRTAAC